MTLVAISMVSVLLESLSTIFGIGVLGCAVVLLMTFWEDVKTVLGME